MTATPKRLLRALDARDGHLCAAHGTFCSAEKLVPQHRGNRGMGGRPSAMSTENLVWLCSSLNGEIESDPSAADGARHWGWKISSFADPAQVPVLICGVWYLLVGDIRQPLRDDEAVELRALYGMEASA